MQGLLQHIVDEHPLVMEEFGENDESLKRILTRLKSGAQWSVKQWQPSVEWYEWHVALHHYHLPSRECVHTHGVFFEEKINI